MPEATSTTVTMPIIQAVYTSNRLIQMDYYSTIAQPAGGLSEPGTEPVPSPISAAPLSDSRFWREFSAGMQMLMQYRSHINGDLKNILHRNLLLLYQTFKDDPLFHQQLDGLESQMPGNWNTLAKTAKMQCGVVNVFPQSLDLNSVLAQIRICEASNPHSYQQKLIHEQGLLVMLVMKGRLRTSDARLVKGGRVNFQTIDASPILVNSATPSCQLLMLAIS